MQGNQDSFIKSQKKNRRWDDGVGKQGNPKKFKSSKKHFQAPEPQTPYKVQ